MKARPKTGEPRELRLPLKIDRLPIEMQDRIRSERREGRTWMEIEFASPAFKEWELIPEELKGEFPGLRLPHSNLQRWYDLRVEQIEVELLEKSDRARRIAQAFAQREFKDMPAAVMNALGDQVFALLEAADSKSAKDAVKALAELGWLLNADKKLEIQQQKIGIEREKLGLVRRKIEGVKDLVAKKQVTPEELQMKLDEIYGIAG